MKVSFPRISLAWKITICTQGLNLFPEDHLLAVRLILDFRLLASFNSNAKSSHNEDSNNILNSVKVHEFHPT